MRSSIRVGILAFLACVLSAGCAGPQVKHGVYYAKDRDECRKATDPEKIPPEISKHCKAWVEQQDVIRYRMPGTFLVLDDEPADAGGDEGEDDGGDALLFPKGKNIRGKPDPALPEVSLTSVPALIKGEDLRTLKAKSSLVSRTDLSVKYLSDTYIITELGSAVTDHSKAIITAIGTVAATVVLVNGTSTPGTLVFPIKIDLTEIPDNPDAQNIKIKCDGGTCGEVKLDPVSADSILKSIYFKTVANDWTPTIAVPACRTATVVLEDQAWSGKNVELETVVMDPKYVRVVKLPYKGNVSLHTGCGYNIVNEGESGETVWSTLEALGTQIKAYKEVKDAEKADGN